MTSISRFLPPRLKNLSLFKSVTDLADYMLQEVADRIEATAHIDNFELTDDLALIEELFDPYKLAEAFAGDTDSRRRYLRVHKKLMNMKGTRAGLELAFRLLRFNYKDIIAASIDSCCYDITVLLDNSDSNSDIAYVKIDAIDRVILPIDSKIAGVTNCSQINTSGLPYTQPTIAKVGLSRSFMLDFSPLGRYIGVKNNRIDSDILFFFCHRYGWDASWADGNSNALDFIENLVMLSFHRLYGNNFRLSRNLILDNSIANDRAYVDTTISEATSSEIAIDDSSIKKDTFFYNYCMNVMTLSDSSRSSRETAGLSNNGHYHEKIGIILGDGNRMNQLVLSRGTSIKHKICTIHLIKNPGSAIEVVVTGDYDNDRIQTDSYTFDLLVASETASAAIVLEAVTDEIAALAPSEHSALNIEVIPLDLLINDVNCDHSQPYSEGSGSPGHYTITDYDERYYYCR